MTSAAAASSDQSSVWGSSGIGQASTHMAAATTPNRTRKYRRNCRA
jgi:hypothetical protein